MKYVLCLFLIAVIFGTLRTQRQLRQSRNEQERAFVIRTVAAVIVFAIVFTALILFLPNKARVLLLLPAFVVGMSLLKAWHQTRMRLRREAADRIDFERMKRVG
jgi:surface polysaccharide O-acyltransferase-like enzyme